MITPTTTINPLVRRFLQAFVAFGSVVVLLPFAYFALAGLGAMLPGEHAQIDGGAMTHVALARGPIHYDLLIPMTDAVRDAYAFAEAQGVPVRDPQVKYLMLGWGSKTFYTATGTYADLNLGSIWPAVTGDEATMHVDVTGDVADVPGVTIIPLAETQLAALLRAAEASFARNAAGQPIPLNAPPFGPTDAFYAANGHFNILNTCNVWIGAMLRAAGLDFGAWTPTPQAVGFSVYWFNLSSP